MKQQMQCKRATQDLRDIASHDGDFRHDPEEAIHRCRIAGAAGTRQIQPGDQAQAQTQRLQ
jgi:hypothetical protein